MNGPGVTSALRQKLQFQAGRHLYGVLGTYARLEQFENADLAHALDPGGQPFPPPVNLNHELLARIGDGELSALARDEARRPQAVHRQLNQELNALLMDLLQQRNFVILKQIELLFAYPLDLSLLRTLGANENRILLLLPGQRRGEQVILFHEAEPRFHRTIPPNLIADNHLWELSDD